MCIYKGQKMMKQFVLERKNGYNQYSINYVYNDKEFMKETIRQNQVYLSFCLFVKNACVFFSYFSFFFKFVYSFDLFVLIYVTLCTQILSYLLRVPYRYYVVPICDYYAKSSIRLWRERNIEYYYYRYSTYQYRNKKQKHNFY